MASFGFKHLAKVTFSNSYKSLKNNFQSFLLSSGIGSSHTDDVEVSCALAFLDINVLSM